MKNMKKRFNNYAKNYRRAGSRLTAWSPVLCPSLSIDDATARWTDLHSGHFWRGNIFFSVKSL